MREINESAYLYKNIEDETMKLRIKYSLNWFIKKAVVYKRCYYIFSSGSIITPLVLTILNSVESQTFMAYDFKQYGAVLATLATVSASFLALFRFKDHWQEYRETTEVIKAELVKYQLKSGDYKGKDISDLCDRIEAIIAESNADQRKLIETTPDSLQKSD